MTPLCTRFQSPIQRGLPLVWTIETTGKTDVSDDQEPLIQSGLSPAPEVPMSSEMLLVLFAKEVVAFLLHGDYVTICWEGAIYPRAPFSFMSRFV